MSEHVIYRYERKKDMLQDEIEYNT